MSATTQFSYNGSTVTFTREPSPDSERPSPNLARTLYTADGQSASQLMTTRTPGLHILVWRLLTPGSTTGGGGEDWAGILNVYLVGSAGVIDTALLIMRTAVWTEVVATAPGDR